MSPLHLSHHNSKKAKLYKTKNYFQILYNAHLRP